MEEQLGFEAALEIDAQVWAVVPKIQARTLKSLVGADSGLAALTECLSTRLAWEGYAHSATLSEDGAVLEISITACPWLALMHKSGRERLAGAVGQRICAQEYTVWAEEFGPGITFSLQGLLCQGEPACVLVFRSSEPGRDA